MQSKIELLFLFYIFSSLSKANKKFLFRAQKKQQWYEREKREGEKMFRLSDNIHYGREAACHKFISFIYGIKWFQLHQT